MAHTTSSSQASASSAFSSTAIPLTTIFTPPADCNPITWQVVDSNDDGLLTAAPAAPDSCVAPLAHQFLARTLEAVYSPGVCPSGYTPVSTMTAGIFAQATTSLCCLGGLEYLAAGSYKGNCGALSIAKSKTLTVPGRNHTVVKSFFATDLP